MQSQLLDSSAVSIPLTLHVILAPSGSVHSVLFHHILPSYILRTLRCFPQLTLFHLRKGFSLKFHVVKYISRLLIYITINTLQIDVNVTVVSL